MPDTSAHVGIRVAKAVNFLMRRRGNVVPDRYHANILLNPTMVRNARRYLLTNAFKHYRIVGPDPFASRAPVTPPETWLLRQQV
jgi:putative transposase